MQCFSEFTLRNKYLPKMYDNSTLMCVCIARPYEYILVVKMVGNACI